jgi:hypothetical protein
MRSTYALNLWIMPSIPSDCSADNSACRRVRVKREEPARSVSTRPSEHSLADRTGVVVRTKPTRECAAQIEECE